jgi:hypothetical protein
MAANPEDIELDDVDEGDEGEGDGEPDIVLQTKAVPVCISQIAHLKCPFLQVQRACPWHLRLTSIAALHVDEVGGLHASTKVLSML